MPIFNPGQNAEMNNLFNCVNLTEENEKAYQEWLEEYERMRCHSPSQDDREPF